MTRNELMRELNTLLGTSYNWSRLNKLYLIRLNQAIKEKYLNK